MERLGGPSGWPGASNGLLLRGRGRVKGDPPASWVPGWVKCH